MAVDFKKKVKGKTTRLAGKSLEDTVVEVVNSVLNHYIEGNLYKISLDSIAADPDQPRKHFDQTKLLELADSIKSKGVLQPVIIRKNNLEDIKAEFLIVAGERRLRASKIAGLKKIPAIYTKGDPEEIALIENIQRDDLKPVEEAEAYHRVMESHGYTQKQLGSVVGKARSTITELLTLNRLPEELREQCRMSDIAKNTLLEIAKRKDPDEMFTLFNKVKNNDFTVAKIRQLTRPKVQREKILVEERVVSKLQETKKLIGKLKKEEVSEEYLKRISDELSDLNSVTTEFWGADSED